MSSTFRVRLHAIGQVSRRLKATAAIAIAVVIAGSGMAVAEAAPDRGLYFSSSPDRIGGKALMSGQVLTGEKYVYVRGYKKLDSVDFFLDNERPIKRTGTGNTTYPDYHFAGTNAAGLPIPFDFSTLTPGKHWVGFNLMRDGKRIGGRRAAVVVKAPAPPTTQKPTTTTVKPVAPTTTKPAVTTSTAKPAVTTTTKPVVTSTTAKPTTTTVKPFVTTTTAKPTTTTSPANGAGRILFEDDFNGPAGARPDSTKWVDYGSYCNGLKQPGFGYISCSATKSVDGAGNLVLPATPTQGSGLQTQGKFSFLYGETSAWIKTPKQTGYWPAFWTTNGTGNTWVGEIDIMEHYTTWPTGYHVVQHSWNYTGPGTLKGIGDFYYLTNTDLSGGFHKYSARVEPNKITYLFDDKVVRVITAAQWDRWPFGPANPNPHSLILDLAVGGAGGQQIPASESAKMLVSRVEVRAL